MALGNRWERLLTRRALSFLEVRHELSETAASRLLVAQSTIHYSMCRKRRRRGRKYSKNNHLLLNFVSIFLLKGHNLWFVDSRILQDNHEHWWQRYVSFADQLDVFQPSQAAQLCQKVHFTRKTALRDKEQFGLRIVLII